MGEEVKATEGTGHRTMRTGQTMRGRGVGGRASGSGSRRLKRQKVGWGVLKRDGGEGGREMEAK